MGSENDACRSGVRVRFCGVTVFRSGENRQILLRQRPACAFLIVAEKRQRLCRYSSGTIRTSSALSPEAVVRMEPATWSQTGIRVVKPLTGIGKKGRSSAGLHPNRSGDGRAVRSAHPNKQELVPGVKAIFRRFFQFFEDGFSLAIGAEEFSEPCWLFAALFFVDCRSCSWSAFRRRRLMPAIQFGSLFAASSMALLNSRLFHES